MQHYNANRKLTEPKRGMIFDLQNTATKVSKRYCISAVGKNKAGVPTTFTALRYPDGDLPQQFQISDEHQWAPSGRKEKHALAWQHFQMGRGLDAQLILPKAGMLFTLLDVDKDASEGYRVSSFDRRASIFIALRYPSGDRPQRFYISDENCWVPLERVGEYFVTWGHACNDFRECSGEAAAPGNAQNSLDPGDGADKESRGAARPHQHAEDPP